MKIQKLLIANRGEIALRIIKSAHKLGIQCVAIYSNADKHSPHVNAAEFSYALNSDLASESYLNINLIIEIAQKSQCDAIHPGYGFLAENAKFALACEKAGIIFIGPSPKAIELMGDKSRAKAFCKIHNIPVIPGEENLEQDIDSFHKVANQVTYPLLLKASAGGGGKGMKLVLNEQELEGAFYSAKREAHKAFNDDHLMIEKYFDQARHVEVQVLADQHGNVVHLFDRDCSLQRRHQKVIEEAPAFGLKPETKSAMYTCAINLCKLIQYQGVGTMEFLVDEQENFYLMEMNTRLQVEHAVTEQITGIDLVEQQILIAEGKVITKIQQDIQILGHAVEARVYAEDCYNDFLPASGTIDYFLLPSEGNGVRIDHALIPGMEITSFYDPMIAKISCWGECRSDAINKLDSALEQSLFLGIKNNRDFLRKCLQHPGFKQNEVFTKFIEHHYTTLVGFPEVTQDTFSLIKTLFVKANKVFELQHASEKNLELSPWYNADNWRMHSLVDDNYSITSANQTMIASLIPQAHLEDFTLLLLTQSHLVAQFKYNGKIGLFKCSFEKEKSVISNIDFIFLEQALAFKIENALTGKTIKLENSDESYKAPLNGKIVNVLITQNQTVEKDQVLIIIEAMKMEHIIKARAKGFVEILNVTDGDQVSADQLLLKLVSNND